MLLAKKTLQDKKDFDLYNKWNETGIIRDFTEDEIRAWDAERKNKHRAKKSTEFVSDLGALDRAKVYALAAQDEEDILNFNKQYEDYNKTAKSLDEAITNLEEDKTQENYDIAKGIQTQFIKEQELLQATQSKAVDSGLLDRANTLPYALEDLSKNYNRLKQLKSGFKSLGADIGFGVIQIVDTMVRPEKLFAETTLDRNQRIEDTFGIVGLGSDLIKETEDYQKAVQVDEIRSVKDAGRWVAGSAPNLVPSLAMAFTGPLAMPLFFLSGAGGKGMTIAIDQQQAYGRLLENRKILDENPNIDGFEKMFIEQQMEKDAKVVNISNIQAIGTQVLYGAAEVAFEKVGTMALLKGVSKGVKDLPGVTIKEGFKFAGRQMAKSLYKEGGSEFATTFVQNFGDRFILGEEKNLFEGGLESFAQGALMGGGFGAAIAGRGFKQAFVSSLATKAEMAALKDITNKLIELTGDSSIQGPSSLDGVDIDGLYEPEIASAIKDLVKEGQAKEDGVMFKLGSSLSIENAKAADDINLEITKANKRFAQAAANPNVKAAELTALEKQTRQKIDKLYEAREKILTNESSIAQTESNAASQAVYFESSSGYQMYSTKMLAESFAGISLEYSKISEEERQQGYDEAKIALQKNSKDGKQPTAEEIKKEARRIYKVKAYKTRINQGRKNAEKFAEDNDLGVEFIVAEGDTAAEQVIEAYETYDPEKLDVPYAAGATMTLRQAIKEGLMEGSAIKNGPIIINLEVAAENGRTGIFAHEVLHVYAKKIIGKENADLNAAGKVLLDYLEKNQPDLYAKVKFRIDQSYTVKDAEGKEVKSTAYYEEAMNAMSDVLADGQKVDESTIDKIRLFVNKLLPASMAFKKTEGESVYYFVKDFNKSSHFGGKTVKNPVVKVTTPEEDKDKTTEESNKLSITVDGINEQMDELVEKLNDDAIDFDTYNSQMESLEAKLEAAERGEVVEEVKVEKPKPKTVSVAKTEERAKERKSKKQIGDALNAMIPADMTSAEWKNVAGKIIVKLQDGMLFPLVKKMAARMGIVADNVYGKTFQEFYDEVIGVQLVKNIMGFKPKTEQNPNGNDDFGGYLIGSQAGISNRIKEALIKFKKQSELSQADDITTAKGIATEQETAPTLDEKSKYKNLLQQKVLSTEGLKKVRGKMITIVRVLKSKLDTVISKNVSTSPIINEIRLAAGKQLDLTFKEEMGGKKNLQLRNWTIENKQAIVENATTTWLMGKDAGSKVQGGLPIAIEKSVDGKFLPYPEWVGKKIDRETTEGRGQTSGNQIVRRAKSANINDTEFADFITKENGAPIPGRKEALAKMLAEETAFDLLKLDMETDGPVFEALKANQEALGTVITEAVKQEVSRQIERGNIKFSVGQSINEGIDLLANNQADTSSLTVQAWLTEQNEEVKKYWDKYVVPAFAKLSTAVKSEINKNLKAYKDKYPELAAAYDGFAANVLDAKNLKKNAKATADLQGFQTGFSKAIGNLLNSIPNLNILGYSTRSGELNEETRNNLEQEPKLGTYSKSIATGVRAALSNVIVFSMGTPTINALLDFITSNLKSGGLKMLTDLSNSAIGKRMAAAKIANAVLFKFVNVSALESVLDSSNVVKAYEGFLRWLESNNNNSKGLKGLGFLQGIEVVKNQPIYTAIDGKKYYSRGGLKIVTAAEQSSTGKGIVVNTKHTNWKEAEAFLTKKGAFKNIKNFATNEKYDKYDKAPFKLSYKEKLEFVKNIMIADALKTTLEHQKSMGKVAKQLQVVAAEATVEWIKSKKTAEDKNRIMQKFEQKVGQIHSDFGLNSAIGKRMAAAKIANAVLFKFVNVSALESVLDSSNVVKAYEGFLRWLESNNNNSKGLKGLGFLQGIEVVKNQPIYTAIDGKKYYSRGGLKIVTAAEQSSTGKGIVVNTKHTNWKEAEDFLTKKGAFKNIKNFATNEKYDKYDKAPFKLSYKEKLEFVKNIMIADALKTTLEHQKSMGKVAKQLQVVAAEATVEWIKSKKTAEDKNRIMQKFEQKVGQIHSDFGLVFNSAFISGMQNDQLGQTSELDTVRLVAAPRKLTDNILDVNTGESLLDPAVTKLKKEIESKIIDDIAKAQELSSENEGNSLSISKESAKLNLEFNEMIARQKGVTVDAEYSKIVAKRMGAKIGKYKLYLPSSAEDFRLLTGYTFSGKGKQGTADMKWFEDNLIRPYTKAIAAIDKAKQTTKNDFKALNKAMPDIAKTIGDLIPSKDYTNDQAVRVYLWNKAGYNIPGLNQKEIDKLVAYVAGNPRLALYADALLATSKSKKWLKPGEHWDVQTILSDINNLTEKGGRKAYLANWIENVDAIFSEENMNKIEALYGKRHREALEDALYRMKNGTNRPSGANAQVNRWNTWLNNSIGSIMFFNRRSALLQLLSTTNFLNWSDNNPVNAAKAFANQKQYWADFAYIFNSDKLKQRRGGLRADVNEAEIANAAANSKNKATAALSWLLKKGFTPTQIADSFAIASGGATFYRNRINTYVSQGMDVKEAEKKAWLDFIETSDQAQQSGDPSLVSMEQASILGRMVLAFQNTTQQYSRMMKRSGLDLIKRRQMPGTKSMFQSDAANFSRIMYYGALQNLIFSSLSAGLFALIPGFGDNEDEEEREKSKEEKTARILNSSIDSLIRGMGVKGAVVITIKNVIQEYFKQAKKEYRADHAYTILQAVNLSPPIGSKIKKIYSAIKGYQYDKDVIKERGLDLTANGKLNLSPTYRVLGSLSAGALNLPLDRMYSEIQGIAEMLDERNTIYQRLALALGFRSWDVNAKNEEDDLIKLEAKDVRKKEGAQKSKKTREDNRVARKRKLSGMSILERTNFLREEKEERRRKRNK